MEISVLYSEGPPPLVTSEQFAIASHYLEGDVESLVELLNMKIESDIYHALCSKLSPTKSIVCTLDEAVVNGILSDNKNKSNKSQKVVGKTVQPWYHKGRW